MECNAYLGKVRVGALNGGPGPLSKRLQLCAFVAFWAFWQGKSRRKMMTIVGNRRKLWTTTLSPHVRAPF